MSEEEYVELKRRLLTDNEFVRSLLIEMWNTPINDFAVLEDESQTVVIYDPNIEIESDQ